MLEKGQNEKVADNSKKMRQDKASDALDANNDSQYVTLADVAKLIDRWIDRVVKLYKIDREPTEEDKKHSRFYCYHGYVHHPTVECHYIQRLFHEKLADSTLEVGRGTQGVQRNPLPQNDRGNR